MTFGFNLICYLKLFWFSYFMPNKFGYCFQIFGSRNHNYHIYKIKYNPLFISNILYFMLYMDFVLSNGFSTNLRSYTQISPIFSIIESSFEQIMLFVLLVLVSYKQDHNIMNQKEILKRNKQHTIYFFSHFKIFIDKYNPLMPPKAAQSCILSGLE